MLRCPSTLTMPSGLPTVASFLTSWIAVRSRFEAYERSIELGCEEPDVSIALALAQLRLSRFAQALGTLEALAHRVPDFEPAYCHRIQIYTELGQHDQAEQMFYLAQELNEDCPHCFFFVGSSLLARGQTDRAIYCFNKALELDPTYIGVNRRIGRAYRAKGQLDKAREFLIHELRDDPGNTDLLLELADLGLASGQPGAAIAKLQQVVELEPDHVDAQLALGKAYLGVGHAGEALKCFRAVEDYADDPEIKSELSVRIAEALARLDRHAEAISYIESALRDTKSQNAEQSVALHRLLGICLLATDKSAKAADCFRRVLAADLEDVHAQQSLGICLYRQGKYDRALHHCQEAMRISESFGAPAHYAVLAHLRLAQWAKARRLLQLAIKDDPADARLQQIARQIWRLRIRHVIRQLTSPLRWIASRLAR